MAPVLANGSGVTASTVSVYAGLFLTAIGAPWFKTWLDHRTAASDERHHERRAAAQNAPAVEDARISRLFDEAERLRKDYRQDLAELRRQNAELVTRVELLEAELAEWRSGQRGVPGVWVAVPSRVWESIRHDLPALHPSPFPGEGLSGS
jgi:hypothetical protein